MAYEIPTYMEYFHFEPLGYVQARGGERRYVFRTHTDIIIYRAVVLASLGGLLALNPDVDLWRKLFPKGAGRIDTAAAAAFWIRECHIIGQIELSPEHMPRPVGRPKKGEVA